MHTQPASAYTTTLPVGRPRPPISCYGSDGYEPVSGEPCAVMNRLQIPLSAFLLAAIILFVGIVGGRADQHKDSGIYPKSLSDEELAQQIRVSGKDRRGKLTSELHIRFKSRAYRWKEDTRQIVFLKILESIEKGTFYKGGRSLWFWVAKLKRNVGIDLARKDANRLVAESTFASEKQIAHREESLAKEEVKLAFDIIAKMGKDFLDTAHLVYRLDLSHAEAAKQLGVATGTISWRISKIKKKLADAGCRPAFARN